MKRTSGSIAKAALAFLLAEDGNYLAHFNLASIMDNSDFARK